MEMFTALKLEKGTRTVNWRASLRSPKPRVMSTRSTV